MREDGVGKFGMMISYEATTSESHDIGIVVTELWPTLTQILSRLVMDKLNMNEI